MNAYRVSPANRRIILLAVMSLIASLLTINFNAPGARATGETTSFTLGVSNPEEGDGTHPVTATLTFSDPTLLADVTVPVSVNGTSSAGDPGDYTLSTTSFVFSSGATSPATATINVLLTNNTTFEGDETIILDLGTPDIGGTTAPLQHIVTISDAVDTPTIAINSIPVYEDDGTATFTVTRSGATNQTVTADWATANGTATSPGDYTAASGAISIASGVSTDTINVTLTDDSSGEGIETFTVGLTNAANATIATPTGTATITDDDTPTIAINSIPVYEDDGTATFTVTRSGATNQTVTADWATANGTATSPGDYTAASGAISIASGVSTDTINVTLTDDDAVEGIETFTVGLTNAANATIATPTGTATITDDDVATVAFEVATSNENEAASPHDIPVVLSVPGGGTLAAEVTVAIPTPGGSATGSGTDYTLSTSVLTFLIGSGDGASETISLAIEDDSTVESDETVTLALGTVTGPATTSGITSHIHTIADNDIATVAFTNASSNAPEEASPHTLTVTLDIIGTPGATLASAVTVPITDTGGSASGGDYDLDTTSVTFSSGSGDGATRIVSLTIDDDASEESNETIGLGLGTPTAPVTKSGQTTHTVTIIDDESRNITVTPTSGSTVVSEAAGVDTFTVRLTQAPLSGTVTVTLSKSAEGDEFTVSPAQLTFSTDWATPKTVTVTGVNNDIVDGNRAGEVLMSAANGGYSGVTATESVTITDDDVAGVTITESGGTSVVEGSTATDTYTIVLDAEPIANVVVTLISDDEITTSPESVTFTPSNWNTPRTVTVSGVEDGIDELEEDHTIAHTVSSADSMFHNVPMGSVVVSVEDSDELVVVISGPSVGAPGVTSTFEATVNAGGTGDITYQWTAYLGGDPVDTGSIASFDFTPTEGGIYLIEAIVGDSQEQNPAVFIQFRVLGDVGNSIFVNDIVWLAEEGITRGCNPPLNTEYCPTQLVTREQMAAFLVRFLDLTDDGGGNKFVDDDTSIFQDDIAKLAAAGITRGCNPPANTNFCPTQSVTREQMAAFLVRALNLTDDGGGNKFVDDDASIFQDEIAKLAAAGITLGCNPPANTNFCPTQDVTRGQMAAFLRRADAIVNP